MTRSQAIKIYLGRSKSRQYIFSKILLWDGRLSIIGNANKLELGEKETRRLAKNYRLPYKVVGSGRKKL